MQEDLKRNIYRLQRSKLDKIHRLDHFSGSITRRTQKKREICAAVMAPRYNYFIYILIIIGMLIQSCNCAPAMQIRNFKVLQTHLTLKPGTRRLVPCKFLPVHPLDMTKVKLEWGKLSLEEGRYTPIIQLNSEGIRRNPEIGHRFGLFVPLVKKGNCTLIIDPVDAKDTGVYEVWMALDGSLHEAYPKTTITISDQKQASGASRANVKPTVMATSIMSTTAASNQTDFFVMLLDHKHGRTTIIVVIAVLSFLSVAALITTVMCCIYFLDDDDDDDDDDESTDVEAPKEEAPKEEEKSMKDSVHIEDETTTDSESEEEEEKSMKDSVHIEDETTSDRSKEEKEAKFTSAESESDKSDVSESDKSDDWESYKSEKAASEYERETSSEEESSEKLG
ncbi:uncharacterized protein LOC121398374 [Xenopus laevis]|uniref:Uncharacterized protein LOC121398374 n=1 Tax=Xenopus laevis TaxID=8355 RepID=A0A8J1LVF2_XENLA|nr:uncharacterized protein LOC121398374 [Xenopus laevis]